MSSLCVHPQCDEHQFQFLFGQNAKKTTCMRKKRSVQGSCFEHGICLRMSRVQIPHWLSLFSAVPNSSLSRTISVKRQIGPGRLSRVLLSFSLFVQYTASKTYGFLSSRICKSYKNKGRNRIQIGFFLNTEPYHQAALLSSSKPP